MNLNTLTGRDVPAPVQINNDMPLPGHMQAIWRFPNGRGGSVIQVPYHFPGAVELLVARWFGEGIDNWEPDYSTSITDDVIRTDDPAELMGWLREIMEMPAPRPGESTARPAYEYERPELEQ